MVAGLDLDKLYRQLGNPGRFQVLVCLLLYWNIIPIVVNHLAMAIFGADIPHHCKVPDNLWVNESLPVDKDNKYQSCEAYKNFSSATNKTVPCPMGWEYLASGRENTIVSQVCLMCSLSVFLPANLLSFKIFYYRYEFPNLLT